MLVRLLCFMKAGNNMDNIDKKIIKILQDNARATISVISSEISLSMPAVSERLKKLETSGIIQQYTAILNPEMVDRGLEAVIFFSFENSDREKEFLKYIPEEKEIKECFLIAGSFDYCMKVCTDSPKSLENLIFRIKAKGATKTNVMVVLSYILNKPSVQLS